MRSRRPRLSAALAATLAAWACGFGDAPGGDGQTVRDSAGIRIVENGAPQWRDGRAWRLASAPALDIGRVDGPEETQLHRVVGAVRLGDGTIVVANAGTGEVRWFDGAGGYLAGAGREGGGPGEFRRLSWIGRVAGDSVYAWDSSLRRLSVFHAGRFIRDVRGHLPEERAYPTARGVLRDGSLLVTPGAVYVPEERLGVQRPPMPLWILSRAGEPLVTLGPFPGASVNLRAAATPGAWIRTPVPFGAATLVAAAGDRIAVGDNAAYEVRFYASTGELIARIRRTDATPRTVRPEDLAAELERRLSGVPPVEEIREGIRASFRETPAPETLPYYQALVADGEGNLWVRRYAAPAEPAAVWDVFGPDGRWLGPVSTPDGFEVTDIGADYVLGIWKDELDVEHVRMYHLTKP
ncbi:MAG TPA: hypothetical protein VF188_15625 [Longimicrobiales bacterium]